MAPLFLNHFHCEGELVDFFGNNESDQLDRQNDRAEACCFNHCWTLAHLEVIRLLVDVT